MQRGWQQEGGQVLSGSIRGEEIPDWGVSWDPTGDVLLVGKLRQQLPLGAAGASGWPNDLERQSLIRVLPVALLQKCRQPWGKSSCRAAMRFKGTRDPFGNYFWREKPKGA